ncbi:MAG: glycosyltransferase family 39 protein, partial [Candidatus Sifarchaeia archaeon]
MLIPLYITLALLLLMIPLTLFFQQGLNFPEKIHTILNSIWERTSSNEKAISFFAISLLLGLLFVTDGAYEFSWDNTDYYTLVMLIAESRTISSNEYFLGSVCIDNQCYSGRAPGYPFIAVPFYLLFKSLGGSGKVGIKFVSLLFFSLTAFLVFKLGKMFSELTAVIGSVLFIFGTFVIEYAIKIWNHTASLFFVTFSIYSIFLFREKQQLRYLFLSAIGIGIVFMIRYDEILYGVP